MVRFDESRNRTCNISDMIEIPDEAKLCKEEVEPNTETNVEENIDKKEINTVEDIQVKIDNSENDTIIIEKQPIVLEEIQARQKLIEEQNRRRKELLTRVLADKRKQTQEEAQKLNEIQNEFKKLDAVLSNDVKLLRKRIEIASIHYMEAQ